MALRVLVCAIVACVALAGCGTAPKSGSGTLARHDCSSSPCEVPVNHACAWPFCGIDVADEIHVSTARPMTITWTLHGHQNTHFNPSPNQGIVFSGAQMDKFVCNAVSSPQPNEPRVYACTNNAPRGGPYKYTIRTKGWGSPPDKDPSVVND